MKIIDFHTHTFEAHVAARAMDQLQRSANIRAYADGTDKSLQRMNRDAAIALSVVLPVATRPGQSLRINERNRIKNEHTDETGLLYFAAIHPEDPDIKGRIAEIKAMGFRGIKIHPVFQGMSVDALPFQKMVDAASEMELITVTHGGEDISFPGNGAAGVKPLLHLIDTVHPQRFVIAHMGGWHYWDDVEKDLAGADVWFDTSFSLYVPVPFEADKEHYSIHLRKEQFLRIASLHGTDRLLFGTDSPWTDRRAEIELIRSLGYGDDVLAAILAENAETLLASTCNA